MNEFKYVQLIVIVTHLCVTIVYISNYTLYPLGKGVYSQLGNMHWKVDEHLKYLINFPKRKYSLDI